MQGSILICVGKPSTYVQLIFFCLRVAVDICGNYMHRVFLPHGEILKFVGLSLQLDCKGEQLMHATVWALVLGFRVKLKPQPPTPNANP